MSKNIFYVSDYNYRVRVRVKTDVSLNVFTFVNPIYGYLFVGERGN